MRFEVMQAEAKSNCKSKLLQLQVSLLISGAASTSAGEQAPTREKHCACTVIYGDRYMHSALYCTGLSLAP